MNPRNEMLDLINQARSGSRSDAFKRFLNRHSKVLSKVLVLGLLVLIGFFVYNFYKKSQSEKFSETLHQSLLDQQAGDFEKSKEGLKSIYESASAPGSVKALASLRYAAFLLEEGKIEEATKIYQDVNDCKFCDDYAKDLAGLLLVKLWVADVLELQKDDLAARIEKIENRGSVLKYQIAEQRAIVEMRKGNLEKSYQVFELIEKSSDASQTLKTRAADGIKMLIEQGYTKKDA